MVIAWPSWAAPASRQVPRSPSRFVARVSGLASGLALAVRPAGLAALGQHGGVGAVVRLGVLGHDEAIPADARQFADAACGVEVVERSLGDT
jgi:hypothetical protein